MKLTNKQGLPEALVRAIANDPYSRGNSDYSVTELIKPPRIVALTRQHEHEIVEDASDRIYSLLGQISHLIIERAAMEELSEHRLYGEFLSKTISGQLDLIDKQTLIDFKVTSVWAFSNGIKSEWECQLNLLATLARCNSIMVRGAQIVAVYRDWSKGEARRSPGGYPSTQVQVFDVPLWPVDRQESFIRERIALHVKASQTLPECSAIERWAKPEKWAVKAMGRKRAVVLCDTLGDAQNAIKGSKDLYIEHRPGVNTRCHDYCQVSKWCTQFQELQNEANQISHELDNIPIP